MTQGVGQLEPSTAAPSTAYTMLLDLGWQIQHEGLDSEPRSPVKYSSMYFFIFSLSGAHCTASYSFLSISH